MPVYINGFLVSPSAEEIGLKTYLVPGTETKLRVRSDIAPLLVGLATEFHQKVEPLHTGWCWSYAYRSVRGSSRPSFHSAGIAIDLNAPKHPLGVRNTFSIKQRAVIRALAKKYGLRWGGDYKSRADEMHFEVILPKAEALALVQRLQAPAASRSNILRAKTRQSGHVRGPFPFPPTHLIGPDSGNKPTWHDGTRRGERAAVLQIQKQVGAKVDGVYGPETREAVMRWQKAHGLRATGVVSMSVWQLMEKL